MKLWHISDTHCLHTQLQVPQDVDIVVHSGDASNRLDPCLNENELRTFLEWFSSLPIKTKIFVPGNHDTSLERGLIKPAHIESLGIHLLINESRIIEGKHFWGSPCVPKYGDWAWMKSRETINRIWQHIPANVDVLITHGPPYGILDATYNRQNNVELVGCSALRKKVFKEPPGFMLFGHVHSTDDIRNAGIRTINGISTVFSNGSCCDDGKMGTVTSHGNVLEIPHK